MIFRPEFAALVLAGKKTQTRRPVKYETVKGAGYKPCQYEAGRDYAVQPGRGKNAIGRLLVLSVRREPVSSLTEADALAEGFLSQTAFLEWWSAFYGAAALADECWRIEFELAS